MRSARTARFGAGRPASSVPPKTTVRALVVGDRSHVHTPSSQDTAPPPPGPKVVSLPPTVCMYQDSATTHTPKPPPTCLSTTSETTPPVTCTLCAQETTAVCCSTPAPPANEWTAWSRGCRGWSKRRPTAHTPRGALLPRQLPLLAHAAVGDQRVGPDGAQGVRDATPKQWRVVVARGKQSGPVTAAAGTQRGSYGGVCLGAE